MAFCIIHCHFIRNFCAKFGIPYLPQSPDIGKNVDEAISNFGISGQSLIKENCHNSGIKNDIDMKLGPVAKLDKRKKTTSKKLMMTPCQQNRTLLSFFPIYDQLGAI